MDRYGFKLSRIGYWPQQTFGFLPSRGCVYHVSKLLRMSVFGTIRGQNKMKRRQNWLLALCKLKLEPSLACQLKAPTSECLLPSSISQKRRHTAHSTTQSRPVIKDPKIISQIKPHRETKPKAEAWQDPTYSEMFQKQPFKGQKGLLKAMFLTFEKNFWEKF